jgi:hypothetical protein
MPTTSAASQPSSVPTAQFTALPPRRADFTPNALPVSLGPGIVRMTPCLTISMSVQLTAKRSELRKPRRTRSAVAPGPAGP